MKNWALVLLAFGGSTYFVSEAGQPDREKENRSVALENYIAIDPVDVGQTPYAESRGDDEAVNMGMKCKGSGQIYILSGSIFLRTDEATDGLSISLDSTADKWITIITNPAGTSPGIAANGPPGDVTDLLISTSGSGSQLKVNNQPVNTYNNLSVHAAGAAYALTNSAAKLDFGTTDPSLTIDKKGTYLLTGRCQLRYNGTTFTNNRTATLALRRTNNTPTDVTNGTVTALTRITTTLTDHFVDLAWSVLYTTTNTDDVIELFGSVNILPSAGSLDAVEAAIIAVKVGY